jgi:outer membrane immunogenic protein
VDALKTKGFFSFCSMVALCGACLTTTLAAVSVASAADLPSSAPPPVMPPLPAPPFNWTGFYIGVNGGGGLDHFSFPYTLNLPGDSETGRSGITSRGALFGGQVGYNYEFTNVPFIGHAVVGVELDSDWANLNGSSTVATQALGPATFGTRFDNFGTARLRVGYNFDRLLIYTTGGFTYGSFNSFYNVGGFSGSQSLTYVRPPPRANAVGVGIEYALTNNVSLKAEYLYDAVLAKYDTFSTAGGNVSFLTRADYHIVRLGLNYKLDLFSPPAPVIAKY